MKKTHITRAFVAKTLAAASIANAAPAPALLEVEGRPGRAWIHEANARAMSYTTTAVSTTLEHISRNKVGSIYFFEPKEFASGIDAFHLGDYTEALEHFAACRKAYEGTLVLPGNYATLATFYEMECARITKNWGKLQSLRKDFDATLLHNESHRVQVEAYDLYDALNESKLKRLTKLLKKWEERQVTPNIQAQLAYLSGRLEEESGNTTAALNGHSRALALCETNQRKLKYEAMGRSLALLKESESVKEAIELYNSEKRLPDGSASMILLREAAALTKQWELFGESSSKPLPAEFNEFKKYQPSSLQE